MKTPNNILRYMQIMEYHKTRENYRDYAQEIEALLICVIGVLGAITFYLHKKQ